MKLFNIIVLAISLKAMSAEGRRIAERTVSAESPDEIFVAPGLATSLELPEAVTEVITGAPQIFKSSISSVHPNEVILILTSQKPFSTNLIVRTVKRTLVFDLKPSLSKHQDLIVVKGSFGQPQDENAMTLHEQRLKFEKGELKNRDHVVTIGESAE